MRPVASPLMNVISPPIADLRASEGLHGPASSPGSLRLMRINAMSEVRSRYFMRPWIRSICSRILESSRHTCIVSSTDSALSSNAITPNFIFTYEDKDRLIRVDRINRLVFGAFLIMMVLCIGFYQWQGYTIVQKEVRVNQLQQQLYKYIPRVDQNSIQRLVAQIKSRKKTLKSHGEKYLGLSVISELSNLTPTDIQLLSLSADLPRVLKGKKEENVKKTLILEGIVNGNRKTFESILARYMLKLNSSLIFNKPSITERSLEIFDDKKVLRFTTHLELI